MHERNRIPGRAPAVAQMVEAKTARIAACREANAVDANSGFRLEFSDKLAEAVAKQRMVSVKSFRLAHQFRSKREHFRAPD